MNYESWGIAIRSLQYIPCPAAKLPTALRTTCQFTVTLTSVNLNNCNGQEPEESWQWSRLLVNINTFNLYSPLFYGYCVTANYWSPNVKLFSCWKGRRAHLSLKMRVCQKEAEEYTSFPISNPLQGGHTPIRIKFHSLYLDYYDFPCFQLFLCFLGGIKI